MKVEMKKIKDLQVNEHTFEKHQSTLSGQMGFNHMKLNIHKNQYAISQT